MRDRNRAYSNANASSFAIHLHSLMEQTPDTPPTIPSVQSKSARGAVARLLIFLALVGVFFLAIDAVFTPWAFFMGGHFHLSHKWTGWGRMHSNMRLVREVVPLTLHEGSRSDFDAACAALQKK